MTDYGDSAFNCQAHVIPNKLVSGLRRNDGRGADDCPEFMTIPFLPLLHLRPAFTRREASARLVLDLSLERGSALRAADRFVVAHREGVTHFHVYTLNRTGLVYAICRVLGLGECRGSGVKVPKNP